MARIAYVDHSYHQKTLSTQFIPDTLRKHRHTVDFFWDDSWKGGGNIPFSRVADYDVVIMFQCRCEAETPHFRKIHPNVVYIPMLDSFEIHRGPLYNFSWHWEPFQGCKVLSFSSGVHSIATAFGIRSLAVRYYQEPIACALPLDALWGFFWIRHEDHVSWPMVRSLIGETTFSRVHLHISPDPGSPPPALPSAAEIKKYGITTSTWFENKRDLLDIVAQSNIYFAPRRAEGIGQSFLEAMARGQCVVAPDNGTMNEYIIHGLNGLLYSPDRPAALDFSRWAELGENARKSVEGGLARWREQESRVVDFILTPAQELYAGCYRHVFHQISGTALPPVAARPPLRRRLRESFVFRRTERLWMPVWRLMKSFVTPRGL